MSNQATNPKEGDQNPMLETKVRTRTKTKVALVAFLIAAAAVGLSAGAMRVFKWELPFNLKAIIKGSGVVQPPPTPGPDLIVTAFSKNGSEFNITFKNIGNVSAQVPPLFSVSAYRKRVGTDEAYNAQNSPTPLFESVDWKFVTGGAWTDSLSPEEQQTVTYTSTVPPPAGSNKARAVVDSTNAITETNENNNVSAEIDL